MIKKFMSKGIVGIPDMDIELDDSKIILIQGPNGSGKTSLLKRITHPLASYNRFIKLKPGITEGRCEMQFYYKNKLYKVEHVYEKNKRTINTTSHLFERTESGWENVTVSGLQGDFKKEVAYHLNYQDYLYNILNIGIENRGIIDMTNTNRLEYLKKVFNMDILTEVKENVLDKFNTSSNKIKFINNKLEEYPSLDTLNLTIKDFKTRLGVLKESRDNLTKELIQLTSNKKDPDLLNQVRNKKDELENEIEVIKKILNMDIPENYTFETYYDEIKESYMTNKVKSDEKIKLISTLTAELKDINNTSIKDIEDNIEKITGDIENIKKQMTDTFTEKEFDLDKFDSYIDNLLSLHEELDRSDYSQLQVFSKSNIDIYNKREEYFAKKETKLNTMLKEYEKLRRELKELDTSNNLLEKSIPSDCKITTCPIRLEYERQVSNTDLFKQLTREEIFFSKKIDDYEEKMKYEEELTDIYHNFKKQIVPDKFDEFLAIYKFNDINDIISDNRNLTIVKNIISDNIFNKKKYIIIKNLEKDLNKYVEMKKINIDNDEKRIQSLKDKIDTSNKELKEYNDKIDFDNKEIRKLDSIQVNYSLRNITIYNLEDRIKHNESSIKDIEIQINELSYLDNRISEIETKLIEMSDEEETLNTEKISIVADLKNIKSLDEELKNEIKSNEKLKVLKNIVSIDLPARIFEAYLFEISKKVNELLDGFMTIRFDVTEGVDIYCNREGIERYSTDLSQGEKSMLSIALLMAFKPYIEWDIISIDEGDATLDEGNKDKFIFMVRDYSESIFNINQIFLVSHGYQNTTGLDIKVIQL